MRIVLEMPFDVGGKRGWIYYVESLLRELAWLDREDEFLVFCYFFRDYAVKAAQVFCPEAPNFRKLVLRWPQSVMMRLEWGLGLPILEAYLKLRRASVFHAAYVPRAALVPVVLTVHDNMYVRHPEYMTEAIRWGYENCVKRGLRNVSRFIVHSEYHKRETVELLGVDERRIRVVLPGANTSLFHPVEDGEALQAIRRRLKLPERFFMMVGPFSRWWCRYETAVGALARLVKSHPDLLLVLVGDRSPEDERLRAQADGLGVADRLIWLGRVSASDLNFLFNLAVANVYPAWDTGCSFNVLDSMAAGLPVVTSRVSLLPEMLGEAGVWADPESPAEMEAAMRRLLEDPDLRREKSEAGLRRARERTWEETARRTLSVYREVAA